MNKQKNNFIAQSTLEYAVVIVVVVGALLAMFGFLNRHIQGSWRQSADTFGGGRQFGTRVFNTGVTTATDY